MAKLTLDELRALRKNMKVDLRRREVAGKEIQVIVGMDDCGIKAGAKAILDKFFHILEEKNLLDTVLVRQVGCMGYCESEPTVEVAVPGMPLVIYGKVDEKLAEEIVNKHIIGRELIEDRIVARPAMEGAK
ncbi:MAG: (2Fe-2S) ferredoxin domain-containing protein [Treponema sp.]|nr:(2Fe-2S) ferredoxin domain-containing protein [Treponema sp.]